MYVYIYIDFLERVAERVFSSGTIIIVHHLLRELLLKRDNEQYPSIVAGRFYIMLHPPPLLKFLHLFVISSQQLKRWSIRKPFPLGRRGLRPDGREVETGGDRGIPGQQQRSCARNGGCCWGVVQIGGKTWYFDGQATTFKPSRINLGIHLYIYICIYM